MAGKTIYGEEKKKTTLTLTQTAIDWLESQRLRLSANSVSDTIEKLAREQIK